MKRITETDIVALRARAGRARKPRTKTGIDGMEQMVGDTFTITKDSLNILSYAGQCHDAFYSFCKQADMDADYEKGNQWNEMVEVRDRWGHKEMITEEEYIKRQGRPALKYNLINPIIRNVVGQFRDSPFTSTIYSSYEEGQEAADNMSVKLDNVLRYNDRTERDAREYKSFLISGAAIFITGHSYDEAIKQPIPFFRAIDYHRYFQNPDASDIAGKDVWFCGDYADITLDEIKSMYAHSRAQERALEDIYANDVITVPVMYKAFVEANPAAKSFQGLPIGGGCRIIRVCRLEGAWDLSVHDYADASLETYSLREFPNKQQEIEAEIARRKQIALENGVDYEDPANQLKIVYEKKYVRSWMYYHLSPWGHVLWQAENPYEHGGHCYVTLFRPMFQGQVYGLSHALKDPQRMLNRMAIDLDFSMSAAQKGVLIVDEDSIGDDMDFEDIVEEWTKYRGVIKLKLKDKAVAPQQLSGHQVNIGQFEMINLMMKMMMDISGVQGSMQGKAPTAGTPAALYSMEYNNAQLNVLDYAESYAWFLEQRDYKMIQLIDQYMGDNHDVRRFKLRCKIQKSNSVAVARLFNQQLMANLLMAGAAPITQFLQSQNTPFSANLLSKLQQAQQQMQNGQPMTEQQLADIQSALPKGTPEGMAAAMQFANR